MNNRTGRAFTGAPFSGDQPMNQTELAYLPIAELRKMPTEEIRIVFTFRG